MADIEDALGKRETNPHIARFAAWDGGLTAGLTIDATGGNISLLVVVPGKGVFDVKLREIEPFDPGTLEWRFGYEDKSSWFDKWHMVFGRAPMLCPEESNAVR